MGLGLEFTAGLRSGQADLPILGVPRSPRKWHNHRRGTTIPGCEPSSGTTTLVVGFSFDLVLACSAAKIKPRRHEWLRHAMMQ